MWCTSTTSTDIIISNNSLIGKKSLFKILNYSREIPFSFRMNYLNMIACVCYCLNGFSPKNCQTEAIISNVLWLLEEIKEAFHNA